MASQCDPKGAADECAIVELRRYTLHPGARERLISLFEREFVETQEALGMRVIGQFRDLDVPDSFVWFRGFSDMEARKAALTSFYGGPVWAAHRDEANGTMVDSDNVFLLRPAKGNAGFNLGGHLRPELNDSPSVPGFFAMTIYHLKRAAEECFLDIFARKLLPQLSTLGVTSIATLVTEASANTFPRLPVREGEKVLVSLLRLGSGADFAEVRGRALAATADDAEITDQLVGEPDVSHLMATARSLVR